MSNHTPGPWKYSRRSSRCIEGPVAGNRGRVAIVDGPTGDDDQADANAHLIAAAPDIYEALQDAIEYLRPLLPPEILAPHLAAIAKAEGR